uniref:Uncharacterized protein n=1 Tax=Arundo donax TaxID=35708 RepID=A0A0A9HDH6_ARUDO
MLILWHMVQDMNHILWFVYYNTMYINQESQRKNDWGKLRYSQKNGYLPEHWRYDLFNSAAPTVFCDLHAADSRLHFVCSWWLRSIGRNLFTYC